MKDVNLKQIRKSMDDLKNRLIKLELLYMEQEDVVQTLSHLVYQQDDKIVYLQQQLRQLVEKLNSTEGAGVEGEEPPPPHY
jgi:SlyX protein